MSWTRFESSGRCRPGRSHVSSVRVSGWYVHLRRGQHAGSSSSQTWSNPSALERMASASMSRWHTSTVWCISSRSQRARCSAMNTERFFPAVQPNAREILLGVGDARMSSRTCLVRMLKNVSKSLALARMKSSTARCFPVRWGFDSWSSRGSGRKRQSSTKFALGVTPILNPKDERKISGESSPMSLLPPPPRRWMPPPGALRPRTAMHGVQGRGPTPSHEFRQIRLLDCQSGRGVDEQIGVADRRFLPRPRLFSAHAGARGRVA
mmetsp:Transcript_52932/g.120734  ORF Transcript_52932/g.120734 Transcript_52932/m.120734 type:complete len:265 (+) Transcript_52932:168-962(+)